MRGVLVVARRELAGLFLAPLAWVLLFLSLLYQAFFFLLFVQQYTGGEINAALRAILGESYPFWYLAVFLPPLVTMRMISEESRSGMLEFLLTAPVGDVAVVLGKAIAATAFFALLWSSVFLYGLACAFLGAPPDWGVVFTAWLGATLVTMLFSAIGLLWSALTATPLLAAFLAVLTDLALVFLTPFLGRSFRGLPAEAVAWTVDKIDVVKHVQGSFLSGVVDSAHLVFFLAWTAAVLFLAVRVVESRRWMG